MPKQARTRVNSTAAEPERTNRESRRIRWSSVPASIQIPDLTDPKRKRTFKVDPSILANSVSARGWIGIPSAPPDGKKQRLTPEQRVAKQIAEAMQCIAEQAYAQIKQAGITGDEAAILAATDAATRGFSAALVAMQGRFVCPPSRAAEDVTRGRKSKANARAAGKKSRRPSKITDEQAVEAWRAWEDLLNSMAETDRAALSAVERQVFLAEEIEAKTGEKYSPRSAEARVNKALSRA